jgi:hypothetical protein
MVGRIGGYELRTERDGWSATAVVEPTYYNDSVFVEVRIDGLRPCRLKD